MTHPLDPGWTPEDDLRRYYPAIGERLARMPLDDVAQHAVDIERELQDGETITLTISRGWRSEAMLTVDFKTGTEIRYMLVKPCDQPPKWRPIGFTPS